MDRKDITITIKNGFKIPILMEEYRNGGEMVSYINQRTTLNKGAEDSLNKRCSKDWGGVSSGEQALKMLREGWTDNLEELRKHIDEIERTAYKDKISGLKADVVGFMPIVPMAIMGMPNAMLNTKTKPKKDKVIEIAYDMTGSSRYSPNDYIKCGKMLLKYAIKLEAQGYRVKITSFVSYCDHKGGKIYMVKNECKSENEGFDLQRVMFPMLNPAMFRVISFAWYERCPDAVIYSCYGHSLSYDYDEDEADEIYRKLCSPTTIGFTMPKIDSGGEEYIERRLKAKGIVIE